MPHSVVWSMHMCPHLQGFDAPGVEHIPVVQIDLSVPLKVPGEMNLSE